MQYFYTRWTFKQPPEGMDSAGPYHATFSGERTFQQMLHDTFGKNLEEFLIKQFKSEEDMKAYWDSLQPK